MRREKPVRAAPRALGQDDQRQLLRACERASARDRALVVLMLFTALRLAVALDLADVQVTARKGRVVVRSGKGDLLREVPLNPLSAPGPRRMVRRTCAVSMHRILLHDPSLRL